MRAVIAVLARQHGTNVVAGMAMTQELRFRGDGESTTLDVKTLQTRSVQVMRTQRYDTVM